MGAAEIQPHFVRLPKADIREQQFCIVDYHPFEVLRIGREFPATSAFLSCPLLEGYIQAFFLS